MQVRWSKKGKYKLASAVEQCREMFGDRVAERFLRRITEDEICLAAHPHLGKVEPLLAHKKIVYRSLVVHKHYKIVYYIAGSVIRIINFWDTRREPAALVRHIK